MLWGNCKVTAISKKPMIKADAVTIKLPSAPDCSGWVLC
jgi:hypothetical protein